MDVTSRFSTQSIAQIAAYVVSILSTVLGLYSIIEPSGFIRGWGLPKQSASPLIYVLGGRNLALGILLLSFSYRDKLEEVGSVLMCLSIAATLDALVTWRFGDRRKVLGHVVPGVMMAGLGWYFVFQL
jgi:hypothetical protein